MATANDFIFNPSLAHLYQQNAMPMLVRALEAGSPDAGSILAMLTGYSDAQHLVEQLPPFLRSPETAAALHRMIVQRIDPTSNVLGQDPPSSEASAAAQQLYDQYFANSRRWQESSLAARIAAPTMFGGIDAGFMDDDCEKPW